MTTRFSWPHPRLRSSLALASGEGARRSALRRRRTLVVVALSCAAALGCGGMGPATAAQPEVPTATNASTRLASAESGAEAAVAAAQAAAAASGEPVVVDELTTPTELTTALPDGTLEYEVATRPVRVERGEEWIPVDLELQRDGDWYEPRATATPVRFGVGGNDVLAQVQTETGEWVSEVWPHGTLPAPTVTGDTATYPDVLPGVDLKLVATKTGMASVYVVESEAAAHSLALSDLHVVIEGADLVRTASGNVMAEAGDGSELTSGQPLWWDSSDGGNFREAGGDEAPIPVDHEVAVDRVSLDVGASVDAEERRTSSEVTYPIFVDPDWSSGETYSWYTDAAFPNASYLSAGASDVLRVGISEPYRSDMFFQFPLSALSGKQVTAARMNTTLLRVLSCSPGPIGVHTFGPKPAGFTWAQEQSWNAAGTAGWSGDLQPVWTGPNCGAAPTSVGWNVTSGVQAKLGASTIQFAFTYANSSLGSRRHFSRDASLVVTYNSYPNTPTNPTFVSPPRACGTATAPAAIGAADVTVSVGQTDPDAGNVGTTFYLAKASALGATLQAKSTGLAAQGTKTMQFTGLSNGETYAWRARGYDSKAASKSYSAWCYFTVDTTDPAAPTLTSAATAFTVGSPVGVSAAGTSDVAGFVYWVTPGAKTSAAPPVPVDGTVSTATALPACDRLTTNVRWSCSSGVTPKALTVAPVDSLSTLWVSAYDKAGNQSTAAGFPLYPDGNVATPAAPANLDSGHAWQLTAMTSPLPDVITDSNPWIGAGGVDLLLPPTASKTVTDLPDPPLESPVISTNVANAADEPYTASAPIDASKSFTLSMWVQPHSGPSTGSQVIAIQPGSGQYTAQLQLTSTGQYAFCLGDHRVDPSATSSLASNCATGGQADGKWQMVTGIWDSANKQLRLLVGNSISPVASVSHIPGTGTATSDGLIFGPAPDSTRFLGYIVNPVAVPGVVDHNQLAQMAGFFLPFS